MDKSKQENLERFVTEEVGMQIANLRYHFANISNEVDDGEPAIVTERFWMIDALLGRLLNKVQSLKNDIPEADFDCQGFAEGAVVPIKGKNSVQYSRRPQHLLNSQSPGFGLSRAIFLR